MPALVAGIHVLSLSAFKDVDGRDKPGHDGDVEWAERKRSQRSLQFRESNSTAGHGASRLIPHGRYATFFFISKKLSTQASSLVTIA
jgi:hypothetical protein